MVDCIISSLVFNFAILNQLTSWLDLYFIEVVGHPYNLLNLFLIILTHIVIVQLLSFVLVFVLPSSFLNVLSIVFGILRLFLFCYFMVNCINLRREFVCFHLFHHYYIPIVIISEVFSLAFFDLFLNVILYFQLFFLSI